MLKWRFKMDQATEQAATKAKKERVVESVKMQDGRTVEFVGNRRMLKEVIVDANTVSVRFDFRNGNTETFPVPTQHLLYSAGHGWGQKLGDQVAGLKDEATGEPASEDDMQLEIQTLAERLNASPDWNAVATGGVGGGGSVV